MARKNIKQKSVMRKNRKYGKHVVVMQNRRISHNYTWLAGVDFLVTQMFFDNTILYNYMFRLLRAGINVPVVPGIMPVTNAKQIIRICQLSGTKLPPQFRAMVEKFADKPEALKQAGIAYATGQIIDLIANGFDNVHIYTMNKPEIFAGIMNNLGEIVDK